MASAANTAQDMTPGTPFLRDLFDASPIGIALENLDGQPFFVNPAFCKFLGFSEEELRNKHCVDFSPPEDAEKDWAFFQQLRAGLIDHYQMEKRYFRRDGSLVWGSLSVSLLSARPTPLILAMVQDITEKKTAEGALQESEERFRLVANTAPVMIWMSGVDKAPTYFNQLWLDFTGMSEADLQNGLAAIVHPEDFQKCHEVYCCGFDQRQAFKKECRLRRSDGQYRWMLDIGVPRFHKDGSFAGYIGSCIDVTDQKLAEEAQSEMTGKLIEAQEQERARIARELHDDINQRLAVLGFGLDQLKNSPSDFENQVRELRKQTTELSSDVESLSHDLHSAKLEYLGVVAGMESWCREFGNRQETQIDYRHNVQIKLPPEIGLCLFRVLQEALHNAVKHSGVKRVEVKLHEKSGEIHLIVSDRGKGFNAQEDRQSKGLGLISMRERVRLVNGKISIESKPMSGTTVHVRVPLDQERTSERMAV
jgi:PAS domain S-box-containing protein